MGARGIWGWADVANFSPFHFHRIFKALVGETLNRFINRIRIEKAASKLIDNPNITQEDKQRLSVCITVPEDTTVEGEVGKMVIPGGEFAAARFEIAANEYGEAWDMVMGGWLPESGYQPVDRLCYEIYHNDPKAHP